MLAVAVRFVCALVHRLARRRSPGERETGSPWSGRPVRACIVVATAVASICAAEPAGSSPRSAPPPAPTSAARETTGGRQGAHRGAARHLPRDGARPLPRLASAVLRDGTHRPAARRSARPRMEPGRRYAVHLLRRNTPDRLRQGAARALVDYRHVDCYFHWLPTGDRRYVDALDEPEKDADEQKTQVVAGAAKRSPRKAGGDRLVTKTRIAWRHREIQAEFLAPASAPVIPSV